MAELEATIAENSEPQAPEEQPLADAPPQPAADDPPKRGRGRPAGAKDKAPRVIKPKVRVEPIPQPEAKATPKARPAQAPAAADPVAEQSAVEARPPSPEPLSPRTLYRQTSAHLLNLRDVMNSQKRASAAERYTSRLQAWPVV